MRRGAILESVTIADFMEPIAVQGGVQHQKNGGRSDKMTLNNHDMDSQKDSEEKSQTSPTTGDGATSSSPRKRRKVNHGACASAYMPQTIDKANTLRQLVCTADVR